MASSAKVLASARLELPPESSTSYQACLSDEVILEFAAGRSSGIELQAIHAHLDRCETCQRIASEGAHGLANAATMPLSDRGEESWNTTFQRGAVVAKRYVIRRFVARGGMGEVYEAFDQDLQERVALKTVTSTACDSSRAVRRLKAEVQLARRVSHPNVCRIYDLGTHAIERVDRSVHFLTMEFVEGETLGQRIRLGGALPLQEAISVARELLLGLNAAHSAGILHRDFKSDNVMLRAESQERSTPLILDFGLARGLDDPGAPLSAGSGRDLAGTLGYMAPEQVEGKALTVASDLYSFGIVWFEMLTGELPFSGSSAAAAALERLRRCAAAPSSINPAVPKALDAIVLRCLTRSPSDRFRSAADVLAALELLELTPSPAGVSRGHLLQIMLLSAATTAGVYWLLSSSNSVVSAPANVRAAAAMGAVAPPKIIEAEPARAFQSEAERAILQEGSPLLDSRGTPNFEPVERCFPAAEEGRRGAPTPSSLSPAPAANSSARMNNWHDPLFGKVTP